MKDSIVVMGTSILLTNSITLQQEQYTLVADYGANNLPNETITWILMSDAMSYYLTRDDSTGALKLAHESDYAAFTTQSIDDLSTYLSEQSAKIIANYNNGFDETAEDEEDDYDSISYTPDQIHIETRILSLYQLVDMMKDDDQLSEIELSPDFQRNQVWDNKRRSRLIESLLLGLPLPSFFFSEMEDGKLAVVDGVQRLTSIKFFFENKLILSDLQYLKSCNGLTYQQIEELKKIPLLQLRRFRQTQFTCHVILASSHEDLKYDLFTRLNTGGVHLNNSEIRNCLSRRTLQQVIKEMVGEPFPEITGYSINSNRMLDRDLAMRFMYFYDSYQPTDSSFEGYNGNLERLLTRKIKSLNKLSKEELEALYAEPFRNALLLSQKLFGKHVFRKVSTPDYNQRRHPINKLLMTIQLVILAKLYNQYENKASQIEKHVLIEPFYELLARDNWKLYYVLSGSSNSKGTMENLAKTLKNELFDKHLL